MSPEELEAAQDTVEEFGGMLSGDTPVLQLAFGLGAAVALHELDGDDLNELVKYGHAEEDRRARRQARKDYLAELMDGAYTPN